MFDKKVASLQHSATSIPQESMVSKTIICVVGARPNFMKIAPILRSLHGLPGLRTRLIHTGQHYDDRLSRQFFEDLELPDPDLNLEVGSGSHGIQTGEMMKRLEPVFEQEKPVLVLVVGDVNSTLAAALVASKLQIPIAHVEAGLRSFDRSMPEEINRVVTDVLSTFLFVTEPAGLEHLTREGIPPERIHLVGDVMIDAVRHCLPRARQAAAQRWPSLSPRGYAMITLHRPVNVDRPEQLTKLVQSFETLLTSQGSMRAAELPTLLFPVHPRTQARLEKFGLLQRLEQLPKLVLLPPLGYLEFLGLLEGARFVLTDSGGIQSEACFLRVPCLTLRDTTERPETVEAGANLLLGDDPSVIPAAVEELLRKPMPGPPPPARMDGEAAPRIVEVLHQWLKQSEAHTMADGA